MLPRLPFAGSHDLVCPPPRRRARPRQLPSLIRHRNSAGAARPSVARAPPRVCDGTMSCHLELRPGLLPLPLSPCLCHCPSSLCQATLSQPVVIFRKICAVCCSPLRSECYLWLVRRGRAHHDNNADAAHIVVARKQNQAALLSVFISSLFLAREQSTGLATAGAIRPLLRRGSMAQ